VNSARLFATLGALMSFFALTIAAISLLTR